MLLDLMKRFGFRVVGLIAGWFVGTGGLSLEEMRSGDPNSWLAAGVIGVAVGYMVGTYLDNRLWVEGDSPPDDGWGVPYNYDGDSAFDFGDGGDGGD